jgi:hypothetical protein
MNSNFEYRFLYIRKTLKILRQIRSYCQNIQPFESEIIRCLFGSILKLHDTVNKSVKKFKIALAATVLYSNNTVMLFSSYAEKVIKHNYFHRPNLHKIITCVYNLILYNIKKIIYNLNSIQKA